MLQNIIRVLLALLKTNFELVNLRDVAFWTHPTARFESPIYSLVYSCHFW